MNGDALTSYLQLTELHQSCLLINWLAANFDLMLVNWLYHIAFPLQYIYMQQVAIRKHIKASSFHLKRIHEFWKTLPSLKIKIIWLLRKTNHDKKSSLQSKKQTHHNLSKQHLLNFFIQLFFFFFGIFSPWWPYSFLMCLFKNM